MVATVILTVGVLGLLGAALGIQKGIQNSKNKTLAANLAQEKMQILTQKNYYQVLISTDPSYYPGYSPMIPYDGGYFPPEPILEGSVRFTRLTLVQVVTEDSGVITVLPASTPDTGMKLITITVVWNQSGNAKKMVVKRIFSNPNSTMGNAIVNGVIRSSGTGAAIPGALVSVAENFGWRDTANSLGKYSINMNQGTFDMVVIARGYFPVLANFTISANQTLAQDFYLAPISSGTVRGTAWMSPNLVISQVVAATQTLCGDGASHSVEYVALLNPTRYAINIGITGPSASKNINIEYRDENASFNATDAQLNLTHVSTHVPAGATYLIANATYFFAAGGWRTADAYYMPTAGSCGGSLYCDTIRDDKAGGIQITRASDASVIDKVGWNDIDNTGPIYEASPIDLASSDGLAAGSQIVRISTPAASPSLSDLRNYAGAYDSGNNSVDFSTRAMIDVPPRSIEIGTQTAISGVPPNGAYVSASDGLSNPTTAYLVGSPPHAEFILTEYATGTWTVEIASGGLLLQSTVTVATSGGNYTFPSSATILNQANVYGFITGTVTDALGAPITSPSLITVSPGSAGVNVSAAGGRYFLSVTPGLVDVTANPGNANPNYVIQSSQALVILLGQVKSGVNFVLSQGGRISGFVSRDGTNPLPGVAVAAIDVNGIAQDQQVSDLNGRFTTVSLDTGTYSVEPALGSHEASSPTATTAVVTLGSNIWVGTFTISGSLGAISGTVSTSAGPITTGVLIVVTTNSLPGTPVAAPSLSSLTLTGISYYSTSSYEDGTYLVEVRQSSVAPLYHVYGYYSTVSSTGAITMSSHQLDNVPVIAGQTTTGQNLPAW